MASFPISRVYVPLPTCCQCNIDALTCSIMKAHGPRFVRLNQRKVSRWRAKTALVNRLTKGCRAEIEANTL